MVSPFVLALLLLMVGYCNLGVATSSNKCVPFAHTPQAAGEPTNLAAVQQSDTSIELSWESPGSPATGYVIYYQPEGGAVSSLEISGRTIDSHLLEGLESGVTYSISIVAVSDHLPSAVVGPVTASMLIQYTMMF